MHTITTGDESLTHTISPREDHKSPIHKQEGRQSPQHQGGRPMRRVLVIAGAMAVLMMGPHTTGWAEETEFTPAQMKQIQKMFEEWQAKQKAMPGKAPTPPAKMGPSMPAMGDTTKKSIRYGTDFSGGSGLQGGRTIYARPFVKAPKTIIGGYIDFTLTRCQGGARDCDKKLSFDQERLVPFFYSQITDRLSMAAEIEFEHGGTDNNQGDGDVKVEFATMDYRFNDAFNLRGGIILSPMGRFNLIHDSPLNDLPLRPMVSRAILPSTLAESGLGFFGTFYPTALSKIDYEFYIVNGFTGDAGRLSEGGTKNARGSQKVDNNDPKSILSRVSFSPMLGIEVAGSVHHGKWDNAAEHDLTLLAIDGNLQRGPFEIQGEAAWANLDGSGLSVTRAGTTTFRSDPDDSFRNQVVLGADEVQIIPENMFGYYVQLNYHFMPEALRRAAPSYFGPDSTFTGIVRWGQIDTNTDSALNKNDQERLTLGINFRPIEDSVIKFSYTWNREGQFQNLKTTKDKIVPEYVPGRGANGFQFNMSTYF